MISRTYGRAMISVYYYYQSINQKLSSMISYSNSLLCWPTLEALALLAWDPNLP
jgi:hypothetical protein